MITSDSQTLGPNNDYTACTTSKADRFSCRPADYAAILPFRGVCPGIRSRQCLLATEEPSDNRPQDTRKANLPLVDEEAYYLCF